MSYIQVLPLTTLPVNSSWIFVKPKWFKRIATVATNIVIKAFSVKHFILLLEVQGLLGFSSAYFAASFLFVLIFFVLLDTTSIAVVSLYTTELI